MDDNLEDRKIFIGDIHHTVDEKVLRGMFSRFGTIKNFYKSNGYPFTFALITYTTTVQATTAACLMDETVLNGRKIRVNLASDRDKEFLDNISAESCDSDDECSYKENGKYPNDSNRSKPKIVSRKKSRKRFKRYYELNGEKICPENQITHLQRTSSLSKISQLPINSRKRCKSSKMINRPITSSKSSESIGPKNKYKKVNFSVDHQPNGLPSSSKNFDKFKKRSFENLEKKLKEFSVMIDDMKNSPEQEKTLNFIRNSNSEIPATQVSSPDCTFYNPFNGEKILSEADKNIFKLKNLINPFKSLQSKFKNNSGKKIAVTSQDKNAINLNESQFHTNETAFGFRQNLFVIDKHPSTSKSTSESQKIDPNVIVIDSPPPSEFGDTTLFSAEDIDERLNKSIEIITLD